MKNIEQILKDAGIEVTDEQKVAINTAVSENYKTVADYEKQTKKLTAAEDNAKAIQSQLDDSTKTITDLEDQVKNLSGVDVEGLNKQIADYKERAEKAEKDAKAQILRRDQSDYLKAEFDKLGISSDRTRKSLMDEIMGEDGLKWKDGTFMGLSDYLSKENEKDHFYQTQEEKDEAAKKAEAEKNRARQAQPFTQPQNNQPVKLEKGAPDVPIIF